MRFSNRRPHTLTDAQGRKGDFRESVIILTSNLGTGGTAPISQPVESESECDLWVTRQQLRVLAWWDMLEAKCHGGGGRSAHAIVALMWIQFRLPARQRPVGRGFDAALELLASYRPRSKLIVGLGMVFVPINELRIKNLPEPCRQSHVREDRE